MHSLADAIKVNQQGFIVVRYVEGASAGVVLLVSESKTILHMQGQKSGNAKSTVTKGQGEGAARQLVSNDVYPSR